LEGFIDRVDEQQGTVRLIDYKSGADKKGFLVVLNLFLIGKIKTAIRQPCRPCIMDYSIKLCIPKTGSH
jgi:RecB family exonuclease